MSSDVVEIVGVIPIACTGVVIACVIDTVAEHVPAHPRQGFRRAALELCSFGFGEFAGMRPSRATMAKLISTTGGCRDHAGQSSGRRSAIGNG